MTDRELREIKRRFRPDKCNAARVVGAYVNSNKEIVYKINQPLGLSEEETSEKLLSVMKKVLSGNMGTSVSEIEFSTHQVESSEEHKLLMELRGSELRDTSSLDRFYKRVAESVKLESNFVILLLHDVYDVYKKSSDGESADSTEMFSYITCAICPVKDAPESLTFREADSLFHTAGGAATLASPELGFVFPAFDDRTTNIYGALYYSRSRTESQPELTKAIFGCDAPMPQAIQKATFNDSLTEALSEECTLEVVRAVHAAVADMVTAHKESRDPEPLTINKNTVKTVLEAVGVEPEKIDRLSEAMDESFGLGADLAPKNVVAYNKFDMKMPEVKISINPEYANLVSTRELNGETYLTIKVTGPVELNGIVINCAPSDKDEESDGEG